MTQQTAKFCTIEMKIPTSAAKTVNSSQLLYALSFSAQTSRKLGNVCSVEYLVIRLKFVSRERTSYCSPCNYEPVTLSLCVHHLLLTIQLLTSYERHQWNKCGYHGYPGYLVHTLNRTTGVSVHHLLLACCHTMCAYRVGERSFLFQAGVC